MPNSTANALWLHPLGVADLAPNQKTEFCLTPDAKLRQAIARALNISKLRKLKFRGHLSPLGQSGWQLAASLGATAEQPCIITLKPVTTRIDEKIERRFVSPPPDPAPGSETEIPADETIEAITSSIELGQIMVEALALALPQFPRAPGAELKQATFTEPGKPAMSDADARPFARLKILRDAPKNDIE